MKTIGFPISHKENEKRRALVPNDLKKIVNISNLYFEKGYGLDLGYSDEDYIKAGANITDRDNVLKKDIICDPKIGDAEYLDYLKNQTVFGWIHAVQNREITDKLISNCLTAYAWEDMYDDGRHVFWRNNEIAGEAAILHAYMCYGVFPYNTKVAVIGRGNTARGAIKTLNYMGANVMCYDRRTERLLRKEISNYDVIVNAVLWDTKRSDHILYKQDLNRMKKNSMIIDISCDKNGGIESSVPTTIDNPTYYYENVLHYVVDHTPSIFYKTATESISHEVCNYIDCFIEEKKSDILSKALIIHNGQIVDHRIIEFQKR